jgi:hypothetical protein
VKNHTSSHDINETFLVLKTSWTPNNGKPVLQSTKSSFNILSTCFLCFCKFNLFLCFGLLNGLHKCCPRRKDVIGKVITKCIVMAIHFLVARRSFSTCKFGK